MEFLEKLGGVSYLLMLLAIVVWTRCQVIKRLEKMAFVRYHKKNMFLAVLISMVVSVKA